MPRASAAAAARTAQEILEAATTLISRHGFAELSVDEVARAAGVTRGAVYHHYGSKAGMFRAVAEALQASVAESVREAAEAGGHDPLAQLRAGSHAFLEVITAEPYVRILLVDAPVVVGWQQWRRSDAAHSGAHLRDAVARSGAPEGLVDALTVQLSGAMNEAALWVSQAHDREAALGAAHQALEQLLEVVPAAADAAQPREPRAQT